MYILVVCRYVDAPLPNNPNKPRGEIPVTGESMEPKKLYCASKRVPTLSSKYLTLAILISILNIPISPEDRPGEMRLTFPNPLGPQITLDTTYFSSLRNRFPALPNQLQPLQSLLTRRGHLRLVLFVIFLVVLLGFQPSPPFPPSYSEEWRWQRNLPWATSGATYPEGRDGRYLK